MGFEFDELAFMGTGGHAVEMRNPVDFQNTGLKPVPVSAREAELARFEEVLFGYQVGAYTSLEVLAVAGRTIDAIALCK
ncbi:hypothetical protein [Acidovorax cavernicola]|uniref:Uncharacterized protein n=1 Tax=Acidovorax cavernicola TaxID=1675792 RepID=A0A9X8D5E9_9BURK|nr:hypothetical protein [Acidovorax cavernicola]RIX79612.1 hypothetical protein D3H34_14155 [Acidovorax cavernicola]